MGIAAAVPEHIQAQHRIELCRQRVGLQAVRFTGHVLGQRVDREDHVGLGSQFGLGAPRMNGQRGIPLQTPLLQRVVQRNQCRRRTARATGMRHKDMAAVEVLLERAIVLQERMILACANPQVQRRHHFLDDFGMAGRERRKGQIEFVGTHRRDVGFPRMRFDQADMQIRSQLLDAQDKAVENRVAKFGGKTDIQRAGGDGRIEIIGIPLVDRRPEVEHVPDLRAQFQRARRWRKTMRHPNEKGVVEDFAQSAERVRNGRRGHVHLFRHISGVTLAEQLGEDHEQLGIHVHHDQARFVMSYASMAPPLSLAAHQTLIDPSECKRK